jgi:hypothetical protein
MPSNKPRCRSRRRGADPYNESGTTDDCQICQCRRWFREPVRPRGHFHISGRSIPVPQSAFGCQKPQRTMGKSGQTTRLPLTGVLPGREVGDSTCVIEHNKSSTLSERESYSKRLLKKHRHVSPALGRIAIQCNPCQARNAGPRTFTPNTQYSALASSSS